MRKNAVMILLTALLVSGLTASSTQPASASCHASRSHHTARRVMRTYRRTYVSQRVIGQPVYVSRTISQPAVVQRVIEQPIVVRPARRGLIPGIYRFIFGG
jgi:hypothetical protein